MNLIKRSLTLQNKIENDVDSNLPSLKYNFDEMQVLLVELYSEVSKIDPNEGYSAKEYVEEIKKIDKTKLPLFLILLASIALSGSNKREISTKIGLYNIRNKIARREISLVDNTLKKSVVTFFNADLLKKNTSLRNSVLKNIMNYKLLDVHYSTRIWKNTTVLSDKIYNIFRLGFDNKYNLTQMANMLSEQMDVGLSASVRLLKTEMTGVITKSSLEYYKQNGITQVQQISVLDDRTSAICEELDQNITDIDSAVPGENVPPLHPYCRSIIVPVLTIADGR